ncbi:MAG: hypothetical protein M3291_06015 [Actinomycetota bacterium]|nr:hypothetical protein [Actinomycetota bacterium]
MRMMKAASLAGMAALLIPLSAGCNDDGAEQDNGGVVEDGGEVEDD